MTFISVMVMVAGSFLIFVPPLFLGNNNDLTEYDHSLEEGVASHLFLNALLINAVICLPQALDCVLDLCWNRGYNRIAHVQTPFTRLLPTLIFGIPDLLMFIFRVTPKYINQTMMSQSIGALGYIVISLQCDDLGIWSKNVTRRMIIIITIIGILAFYAETVSTQTPSLYAIMYVLYGLATSIGLTYFIVNCYSYSLIYPGWSYQSSEQFFCLIYMALFLFYLLGNFLIWGVAAKFRPLTFFDTRYVWSALNTVILIYFEL